MINQLKSSNVALGYVRNAGVTGKKDSGSRGNLSVDIGALKN